MDLEALSLDELADGICLRAGRIAAAQAELLLWIGEFDRREGWAGPGLLSCAHWLSWGIGMSLSTARDQVRVARRLPDLPLLSAAFADGRVSYSKVRALTRVAEPDDGIDWVELARHSSAAQLEELVRGVRRAREADAAERDPDAAAWRLRTRTTYDERGDFVLTVRGPAHLLPVIRAGLEAEKARLRREREVVADRLPASGGAPPGEAVADGTALELTDAPSDADADADSEAPQPTDGDALLSLAQAALEEESTGRPDAARLRRWQLTAQVDPLSGWARQADGELLPPSSLRAVMRTLPGRGGVLRLRPVTDADLRRHDRGRTAREVPTALRELLGALDGERCRFPGCTRRRRLHAHHVRFWSLGGPTDLANLVLVCSRHHTLVHAEGYRLVLHPDRRLEVHTADGRPVVHHPAQPWGDPGELAAACARRVSAETLPADHADGRLDLRYAVAVLLAQAA